MKRGDERWSLTEKDLAKLPADVRPHVEQMLGRNVFGVVGGAIATNVNAETSGTFSSSGGTFQLPVPPAGMMRTQPVPGGLDPRLEKRLDELDRRMDKLLDMMEKMSKNRLWNAAPEHQEEQ